MKSALIDSKTGEIAVHEIPTPELQARGILVETRFSVVSSGTERVKIETGEKSLLGKARARPDLVRQVVEFARANGLRAAYEKVKARLDTLSPLGYSCSGVVLEAGEEVTEFRPGDRVACAGAGYANHSEVNFIPRNLAVRVPEGVSLEHAAIATIGAVAMHGLRQAEIRFGETVIVIGAGLIGVLAVQLAKAAGCRVVAIDIDAERVKRAMELGAQAGFVATEAGLEERARALSRYGADAAVITAATSSSEPLELAAKLLRDRGRIVVVGDVGLDVERGPLYHKELSLALSRSYGPGRYDPVYEELGVDYPVGYVRWTEQRNIEAFLDALARGSVDVSALLERQRPIEEAPEAYQEIRQSGAYTVLIRYGTREREAREREVRPGSAALRGPVREGARREQDTVRVGCIGAGNFARGTIFPNLRKIRAAVLETVATASGVAAESARRSDGFRRACTPAELLADPAIGAVFILTRHASHGRYVLEAVEQGKAAFIEKPLCVAREELDAIRCACAEKAVQGAEPFLMVGFNRRFAPHTQRMREFFAGRREPMFVHVRVNAGYIPREHWAQQETGGRIVGELCHFVDWARSVIERPIVSVSATALPDGTRYHRDNVAATLAFADGSIANLLYLANGDKAVPKEYFEVFCDGAVARLNDFRTLELVRKGKKQTFRGAQDKGHRRELELTVEAVRQGTAAPIPFEEIAEVTEATFQIEDALRKRFAVDRAETIAAGVETEFEIDSTNVGD
jgi:predicted dehydrogenase/threonine dehydrogenase-like Zn-dependent dehydrogenase